MHGDNPVTWMVSLSLIPTCVFVMAWGTVMSLKREARAMGARNHQVYISSHLILSLESHSVLEHSVCTGEVPRINQTTWIVASKRSVGGGGGKQEVRLTFRTAGIFFQTQIGTKSINNLETWKLSVIPAKATALGLFLPPQHLTGNVLLCILTRVGLC